MSASPGGAPTRLPMTRSTASAVAQDPSFEERLKSIRSRVVPMPTPEVIERVVTEVVSSLSGDITLADLQLYREIEALADYIQTARREIAGLRPNDIREQHIPMATDELDAVVTATADATGIILGAMEDVERLAVGLPADRSERLGEIVIKVYEACGF